MNILDLDLETFLKFVDETIKTPEDIKNLLEHRRQDYQNSWDEYKARIAAEPKQQELFSDLSYQWAPRRG